MAAIELRISADTDAGPKHPANEDYIIMEPQLALFAVADGMTGEAGGELASKIGARGLIERIVNTPGAPLQRLRSALRGANNDVVDARMKSPGAYRMGATITAVLLDRDQGEVHWGQIGDTKLLRLGPEGATRVTPVHSPVGKMLANGEISEEEALQHPRRNEVYRCMGSQRREADDDTFAEFGSFDLEDGMALVISSDGLNLLNGTIRRIAERWAGDPERAARQLVESARLAGSDDDISVIFIATPAFGDGVRATEAVTEQVAPPEEALLLLPMEPTQEDAYWNVADEFPYGDPAPSPSRHAVPASMAMSAPAGTPAFGLLNSRFPSRWQAFIAATILLAGAVVVAARVHGGAGGQVKSPKPAAAASAAGGSRSSWNGSGKSGL
jgi:serine/threonine protein phosphatase PrpC